MAATPVGDLWGIHALSSAEGMTLALGETEANPERLSSLPLAVQRICMVEPRIGLCFALRLLTVP